MGIVNYSLTKFCNTCHSSKFRGQVTNRNRKLLISRAPTKAKSQEPAYSQAPCCSFGCKLCLIRWPIDGPNPSSYSSFSPLFFVVDQPLEWLKSLLIRLV